MGENSNMSIHLIAGGLAGTAGAVMTCPLEVVKTRFQSSYSNYNPRTNSNSSSCTTHFNTASTIQTPPHHASSSHHTVSANFCTTTCTSPHPTNTNLTTVNTLILKNHNIAQAKTMPKVGIGIYLQMKYMVRNEGFHSLFKGLVPNLFGVAPYRAIYFFSYANSKAILLDVMKEETPLLHVFSAVAAGFFAVTVTNPVWFVKTRLQLDQSKSSSTAMSITRKIFREKGLLGFYKGISASYFGVTETALYFVVYEQLKRITLQQTDDYSPLLTYFTSAGFSKSFASLLCYPHEVARTRLREEGDKYRGFMQTLSLVFREEGVRGLYKGLATHLIRQIPNTAIVMTTYELIINYFMPPCK